VAAERIDDDGMLFQHVSPVMKKARSPK